MYFCCAPYQLNIVLSAIFFIDRSDNMSNVLLCCVSILLMMFEVIVILVSLLRVKGSEGETRNDYRLEHHAWDMLLQSPYLDSISGTKACGLHIRKSFLVDIYLIAEYIKNSIKPHFAKKELQMLLFHHFIRRSRKELMLFNIQDYSDVEQGYWARNTIFLQSQVSCFPDFSLTGGYIIDILI